MKLGKHTKLFLSFSIPQSWQSCAENLKHISEIFEAANIPRGGGRSKVEKHPTLQCHVKLVAL